VCRRAEQLANSVDDLATVEVDRGHPLVVRDASERVEQVEAAPSIPFAFTTFPGEIWRTPRSWVEHSYPDVIYFNEVDKGGHFAAWEEPDLFTTELRAAFRSLRNDSASG